MSGREGPGRIREWLYRQLIRVHRPDFRRMHVRELVGTFREAWLDRARGRGFLGGVRFWWTMVAGEVRAGLRGRRSRGPSPFGGGSFHVRDVGTDVRFAVRLFGRSPGVTAAVLLTLGVGIGGASSIFGTYYQVYASALPFRSGDRLVRLRNYGLGPDGDQRGYNMPPRDAVAIRDRSRTLTGVVAMNSGSLALSGNGSPERISSVAVSAGWSELLGIKPALGRPFTAAEEAAGADAGVALISWSLWQSHFGGDASVLGGTLPVDGRDLTVVGVMSPRFHYPYEAEVWTPLRLDPADARSHDLNVVGRMRDGVDMAAVRADMARIYAALKEADPAMAAEDGIQVRSVREDFIRDAGGMVQALLVAVGLFLVLACVNVANLLAAHFLSRRREMAIRAALGADGGRQLRQTVTETLVLFLAGCVLGVVLARWLGDLESALLPSVFRRELVVGAGRLAGAMALFALGVALAAGLASGLAAAWRAARFGMHGVLKEGGRGSTGRRSRTQDVLVVTELALSVVLLVGAAVMLEHFRQLRHQNLGFDPDGVETLQVSLESSRYDRAQVRWQLVHALEKHLSAVPGVEGVGFTSVNPLCCGDWLAPVEIEGRAPRPDGIPLRIHHRYVTPDYFKTMGIPVLDGSIFPAADRPGGPGEVIIDENMARRHWPGEDPVGRRIRVARPGAEWKTVVGVVGSIVTQGDYDEGWYLPFYQEPMGRSNNMLHVMIRARDESVMPSVRRTVAQVAPDLPVFDVTTMRQLRRQNLAQDRLGAVLTMSFAAFGLLLAVVGLYSLMAYLVAMRTHEIGTRVALGASKRSILGLVLRRAGKLITLGGAIGGVLALALNRVLGTFVVGVHMASPTLLARLVLGLMAVALAAAAIPAARAARVDPVRAFRVD